MESKQSECSVCKREARILGSLIVAPPVLGVVFAILLYFSSGFAKSNLLIAAHDYRAAGVGAYATIDSWCPLCVGLCSLIVGATGWFVIMKKKLYRCVACSNIVESN